MLGMIGAIAFILICLFVAAAYIKSGKHQKIRVHIEEAEQERGLREVVVTDFDISFINLVFLMIKASIASIPAFIILMGIWYALGSFLRGMF
jgi:hypothetical protein